MPTFPVVPRSVILSFLEKPAELKKDIADEFGLDGQDAGVVARQLAGRLGWEGYDPQSGLMHYSAEERGYIEKELGATWHRLTDGVSPVEEGARPCMLATFGSPGAGKTTLLEQELQGFIEDGHDMLYLDPDEQVLMNMARYGRLRADAASALESDAELQVLLPGVPPQHFGRMIAYSYWRWASNHIQNVCMNAAVVGRYNIAFGTTATGAGVEAMFLHDGSNGEMLGLVHQGYAVDFIVADAPSPVKAADNERRWKEGTGKFVPKKDLIGKADAMKNNFLLIPRIAAESGGAVHIYWRPAAGAAAMPVASLDRGGMTVNDNALFKRICADNGAEPLAYVKIFDAPRAPRGPQAPGF